MSEVSTSNILLNVADFGPPYYGIDLMPRLADTNLHAVVYLYSSFKDACSGTAAGGCASFVSLMDEGSGSKFLYAITCSHVIAEKSLFMRINRKDPSKPAYVAETTEAMWQPHPEGDDISALQMGALPTDAEIAVDNTTSFVTHDVCDALDIGIGDNVFMTGRQAGVEGKLRNHPTMRFGNISRMYDS